MCGNEVVSLIPNMYEIKDTSIHIAIFNQSEIWKLYIGGVLKPSRVLMSCEVFLAKCNLIKYSIDSLKIKPVCMILSIRMTPQEIWSMKEILLKYIKAKLEKRPAKKLRKTTTMARHAPIKWRLGVATLTCIPVLNAYGRMFQQQAENIHDPQVMSAPATSSYDIDGMALNLDDKCSWIDNLSHNVAR